MTLRALSQLRGLRAVSFHAGMAPAFVTALRHDYGIALPGDHLSVLQGSNGIEVYSGYVRLFGIYSQQSVDAITWNQPEYWKFAWGDRCSGYWSFAETAWGDQYAYSLRSLADADTAEVYFLDALSMTAQVIAPSFKDFLENEFLRAAQDPYDVILKQARQKFGPLELDSHLTYVPSVLLGGTEDIQNVEKMNARSAMICNGDIATQLDSGPPDRTVAEVQVYDDELHRMRLRLVWD